MEDYRSVMAVRPSLHPDKPGVEFSVTAFEDPGVTLPDTIVNWSVALCLNVSLINLNLSLKNLYYLLVKYFIKSLVCLDLT